MTDDLLAEFLVEGRALVQQAEEDVLALERDAQDAARIASAFRAVHTLKGNCGIFDFAAMGEALHAAEDVLGAVREGQLHAAAEVIDTLLDCITASDRWLSAIGAQGGFPAGAAEEAALVCLALRAVLPDGTAAPAWLSGARDVQADWVRALTAGLAEEDVRRGGTAFRYRPAPGCFLLGEDPFALLRALPALAALRVEPCAPVAADFDPLQCHLAIMGISTAPEASLHAAFRFVRDQVEFAGLPAHQPLAVAPQDDGARFLRVDAARIDALADIVGELIVAKNGLAHDAGRLAACVPDDTGVLRSLVERQAEIDRLTQAMQRAVMAVRMTPFSRIFRRLPRLVRDIAAALTKDVALDISGDLIEADKAVVDGLSEPLLHVLRNAVDHGIETPARRRDAGKPPVGRITVSAAREGSRVVVTVRDDGAGIDRARIIETARARGLATDQPPEALIFAPGFSTAREVTGISGRGVGMDAVRAAMEALGGGVSLTSEAGAGTAVRLSLPHAVLVTRIVLVWAGGQVFGVPIESVAETVRLAPDAVHALQGRGEAFVHRGRTVPLLRLSALLGLDQTRGANATVLILSHGGDLFGLAVDRVGARMDALLRPLTGMLAGMRGVQGTVLMGDGGVLLVLDLTVLLP
jgi:two-component system chemotaxis sensor kinase CheA